MAAVSSPLWDIACQLARAEAARLLNRDDAIDLACEVCPEEPEPRYEDERVAMAREYGVEPYGPPDGWRQP